jgi:hypothetical protein
MNRIYRYGVPVDDQWHVIPGCSPALYVACREVDYVEFWAHPIPTGTHTRAFRVYGTGHDIEPNAMYVGTALAPVGGLVWHLMAKWVKA